MKGPYNYMVMCLGLCVKQLLVFTRVYELIQSMQVLLGYFLLIGHLYLITVWLGEDQRTNVINTKVQMRLDYVSQFH